MRCGEKDCSGGNKSINEKETKRVVENAESGGKENLLRELVLKEKDNS